MNPFWIKYLPRFIARRLEGRFFLQKIIGNTGWMFSEIGIRMVVGLIVIVWVARYLGPNQFGIYSYAIAFVALFSTLAALGLDPIVVRDLLRDPPGAKTTLGSAFVLKLAGGAVGFVLTFGAVFFLRPEDSLTRALVILIALGLFFRSVNVVDFWFQSQVQAKYSVYARTTASLLVSAGQIGLILLKAPLLFFGAIVFVEVFLVALGLVVVYLRVGYSFSGWRFTFRRGRELLMDSFPLILSGIAGMVYMKVDQVMIGQLSTLKEVGNYSAAARLVEAWYIIPMTLTTALFPAIVESKKLAPEVYEGRMQKLYDLMIWTGIGIAASISLFADPIIRILFGEEYSGSIPVLSLQVWLVTIVFFSVARGKWLISNNLGKDYLFINLTGVVLNIGANFLLIPDFGALGATMASLVTAFGANIVVALYSKPIRHSLLMYLKGLMLPLRIMKGSYVR